MQTSKFYQLFYNMSVVTSYVQSGSANVIGNVMFWFALTFSKSQNRELDYMNVN